MLYTYQRIYNMSRGGKREGAGRPKGQGIFGEPTKVMRIPCSRVQDVILLINSSPLTQVNSANDEVLIPLYGGKVAAGEAAPTEDHVEEHLNLNSHLIKNPSSTFMVRATGDSMINAGIFQDDIMIVDRDLPVTNGNIVVAAIDGDLTVKRLQRKDNKLLFLPENDNYSPIDATQSENVVIWGTVTNVIHSVN